MVVQPPGSVLQIRRAAVAAFHCHVGARFRFLCDTGALRVVGTASVVRPPGPRGREIALAIRFRRRPVEFFHDVVREFGNVCSFEVGTRRY